MKNNTRKWILLIVCFCCGIRMVAQENDAEVRKVEWGAELTSELQMTHTGNVNFANLLRLQASVPLYKSLSVDVGSISTYMTSEGSIGGDLQTFSNLDAGNIPFALSVCGLNWDIDECNALFVGVRNMNEDYFTSPVTSLFTNSSCGIFPTISANYPIANYPVASVGMHYKYNKVLGSADGEGQDAIGVQASLYNGTGYNRFFGRESVFRVCPKDDGVYAIAQAEYQHKGSSYFLGACGHYGRWVDEDVSKFGTTLWAYAEQRLSERLHLIASYSHAFTSESFCTDFVGIGGMYSWKRCEGGIFTDYARFSGSGESATELTCNIRLNSHISLQPTAHFIFTHFFDADTDDIFNAVGTIRVRLSF